MLGLLDNNYNILKNVGMGGNCMLKKYLMKINLSKYINYLITCVEWPRYHDIIHKYTSF
jgi:hypothetical protein